MITDSLPSYLEKKGGIPAQSLPHPSTGVGGRDELRDVTQLTRDDMIFVMANLTYKGLNPKKTPPRLEPPSFRSLARLTNCLCQLSCAPGQPTFYLENSWHVAHQILASYRHHQTSSNRNGQYRWAFR